MKLSAKVSLLVGVGLLALLYGYRLNFPPDMYYDEVYHVKSAREVTRFERYTDVHPPLGHLIHALSIKALGDRSWAWRSTSLLASIALILMVYLIAKKWTGDDCAARLAVFFFSLDCISLTQARIMMHNSLMLLFMMLSLYALMCHTETDGWPRKKSFLLSGIFLGLGAATRWVALGIGMVLDLFLIKRFRNVRDKGRFLLDIALFLLVVPVIVYFAAHLIIPFLKGFSWSDIWGQQVNMFQYHKNLKETHGYGSEWWGWPLLVRPIWYFFERKEGLVYGILCIGNPATFWMIPVAMSYLFWDFLERKSFLSLAVLAGFLSQWLPWAFVGRVKFFHYFYTAMPFVAIALALLFTKIWRMGTVGRWVAGGYLLLVIGMFVYWYPLLTGIPISEQYFQNHLWFKSWV